MKKIIIAVLVLTVAAATAMADGPKMSIEFGQSLESPFVQPEGANFTVDNVYSATEFKAKAKFGMGNLAFAPWIKGKFELDDGTWTNYSYLGLDLGISLSDAMSLTLKNELYLDAAVTNPTETEYTPKLAFSASFGDLSLDLSVGDEMTFKASELTMDIEAGLDLGYSLGSVGIGLSYALNYDLGSSDVENDEVMENDSSLIFTFVLGDIKPFIGAEFDYDMYHPVAGAGELETRDNYIGAILGATMKKDNWSLKIELDLGQDSEQERLEGNAKVSVSTKI